jgi:hypothetical protein
VFEDVPLPDELPEEPLDEPEEPLDEPDEPLPLLPVPRPPRVLLPSCCCSSLKGLAFFGAVTVCGWLTSES